MNLTVKLTTRPWQAWPRIVITVVVIIIVASSSWAAYGPAAVIALFAGGGILAPAVSRYTGAPDRNGR